MGRGDSATRINIAKQETVSNKSIIAHDELMNDRYESAHNLIRNNIPDGGHHLSHSSGDLVDLTAQQWRGDPRRVR